ncbi:MAG: twin-arginine translocation pathway signal protein [Roseibium sp.]|uniref:twin-arginine translocation pathway signal protein n=1 Tax=Roseibium sp. TaxID=1936156 RepID=UPI002606E111|nr:twin-arginine translocation pathway signal protein [Roseibium sp.]MCV0424575.1 twin-arginine translocation pathway signal protein [Roseibium sp.]
MKRHEKAEPKEGAGRRDFLKLAALSAPAAVAATAAAGTAEATEVDPTSTKMQDTAHTRAYFDSARF